MAVCSQFFALPSNNSWVALLGAAGLIKEAKLAVVLAIMGGALSPQTFVRWWIDLIIL